MKATLVIVLVHAALIAGALPAVAQEYDDYAYPYLAYPLQGYERDDGVPVLNDTDFCTYLLASIFGTDRAIPTDAVFREGMKPKDIRSAIKKYGRAPATDEAVVGICADALNQCRSPQREADRMPYWSPRDEVPGHRTPRPPVPLEGVDLRKCFFLHSEHGAEGQLAHAPQQRDTQESLDPYAVDGLQIERHDEVHAERSSMDGAPDPARVVAPLTLETLPYGLLDLARDARLEVTDLQGLGGGTDGRDSDGALPGVVPRWPRPRGRGSARGRRARPSSAGRRTGVRPVVVRRISPPATSAGVRGEVARPVHRAGSGA